MRHGWSCIHKGNILYIITEPHSPRASYTRCSSNINVLFHTTVWLRFLSQISSPEGKHICLPFLQVQHLLRSCPRFTDGEIESQRWDLTELRLQTCAPLLTHLRLICSSALTERNINRSDSQTGQHPWSQNTHFPLPSISAHLFNCQIFKAEIWVCIYDMWPAGKLCVHIWCDINNKWEYRWYFAIFSKRPILLDFLGLQGPI